MSAYIFYSIEKLLLGYSTGFQVRLKKKKRVNNAQYHHIMTSRVWRKTSASHRQWISPGAWKAGAFFYFTENMENRKGRKIESSHPDQMFQHYLKLKILSGLHH